MVKTSDFDYSLPPGLIAQTPIERRDQARLMVLNRGDNSLSHHRFFEIVDYLRAGDVLVFNDSRVIPARLSGRKADTGGRLEILLLRRLKPKVWETLVRPGKRVKIGSRLELFVDDHLIDEVTGDVRQQLLRPEPRDVVFVADESWEGNTSGYYTYFRDGDLYRMIYRGWQHDAQKKAAHQETRS